MLKSMLMFNDCDINKGLTLETIYNLLDVDYSHVLVTCLKYNCQSQFIICGVCRYAIR